MEDPSSPNKHHVTVKCYGMTCKKRDASCLFFPVDTWIVHQQKSSTILAAHNKQNGTRVFEIWMENYSLTSRRFVLLDFSQEENVKKKGAWANIFLNCRVEKTCVTVEDAVPTATGFLVNLSNGLLDSHRRPHRFITPAHFSLFSFLFFPSASLSKSFHIIHSTPARSRKGFLAYSHPVFSYSGCSIRQW